MRLMRSSRKMRWEGQRVWERGEEMPYLSVVLSFSFFCVSKLATQSQCQRVNNINFMLNRIYIPKSISTASTAAQLITFIIIQLRTNEKESRVLCSDWSVCSKKARAIYNRMVSLIIGFCYFRRSIMNWFFLNSSLWSVHHPFIFIAALSAHNVIVG